MPTSHQTHPDENYIGRNLIAARTAKGLSQLALGHAIGWTGPEAGAQIARYEAGRHQPRLDTLQRIAVALGVALDVLLLPAPIKGGK